MIDRPVKKITFAMTREAALATSTIEEAGKSDALISAIRIHHPVMAAIENFMTASGETFA